MRTLIVMLALPYVLNIAASTYADEPIRALLITGGCCHDYEFQASRLIEGSKARASIEWTVMRDPRTGTRGKIDLYDDEDWAQPYDVVVHNECFASTDDAEYVRKITEAHKAGVPAVVIHCAMHTYRAARVDDWREFLGVTSRRHEHQSRYPVKNVAKDHPVMKGFPDVWTSPRDELYVIEKVWPGATVLATSRAEGDGREHAAFWVNQYGEARVFGTTFGHGSATFEDDVFINTVTRGLLWAADELTAYREPKDAKSAASPTDNPHLVTYEGTTGPGKGKHIVFIAGDHEYRGEETLPALARILSKSYGFKSSCFFTTDAEGYIEPGSSRIRGLEALRTADLLVVFIRFQDFPDDEMQHIADYLDSGKPVIGLRTSTHGFQIEKGKKFERYSDGYRGEDYSGGFGRQVLGERWVGHYGRNHRQSSLLILQEDEASHPILRGVKDVHVQCGGYRADPIEGSKTLALGRVLNGMTADSPPDESKMELPVAWYRTYKGATSGNEGRVFTTTHGASEDILNPGFRRMILNAALWCAGLEDAIEADNPIDFIGPYNPVTFNFGGFRKGVKPSDIAGWETPILGAGEVDSKGNPLEK